MAEEDLLRAMAVAIRQQYAAAQEQASAGNKATAAAFNASAETFEATRDYMIANRLSPAEREAFAQMLDDRLAETTAQVRAQSFWSTSAGKATVFGVATAAAISALDLALQIFHMVHP